MSLYKFKSPSSKIKINISFNTKYLFIKKWNNILKNYTGFYIEASRLLGSPIYSLNLLDWLYQQRIWKFNVNELRNMSLHYAYKFRDDEESELISKSLAKQKHKNSKKNPSNQKFNNDNEDELPKTQSEIVHSFFRFIFQYKVTILLLNYNSSCVS